MVETHPFEPFVPKGAKYLLLGSFVGREKYDWYYVSKRNQFWKILGAVYNLKLETKEEKQKLFAKLKLAVTDIIYQCTRKKGNNADNNLVNVVYNKEAVSKILADNKIETILFSSRFAEKEFKKHFSGYEDAQLVALPSPSPRYARMTLKNKVATYKKLLPLIP